MHRGGKDNQMTDNMKNNATEQRQRTMARAALGGILLMVAGGCICVNINIGSGLGGSPSPVPIGPPGGNFVPVTASVKNQGQPGTSQICNPPQAVQAGTYVELKPPLVQWSNTGDTGFQGYLVNTNTGVALANTSFILYWFVNVNIKGCCTNVTNDPNKVGFILPGVYPYRFTVYWKPDVTPPLPNTPIKLNGNWHQ